MSEVSRTENISRTPKRWRLADHLLSLVLFVVGVALTLAVTSWVRAQARDRERQMLERRATNIAAALGNSLRIWVEVLAHVESFFQSSDEVTRGDFRDFVAPALARHQQIAALEWFPRVAAAERAAVEARAHAEGLLAYTVREIGPDGRLVPSPPRDEYVPLLYMEPVNDSAMGLDLLSTPSRRVAVEAARDSGEPLVSHRLRLVEDPPGVYAVAIYAPIFRRGAPRATIGERREAFFGVVCEIFRLGSLFEQAIAGLDLRGLGMQVLDASAPPEEQLLYAVDAAAHGDDPIRWTHPLRFAGREWQLAFTAAPDKLIAGGAHATVLVAGLALSLIAGGLLSATRMIRRLRREVADARRVGQYTLLEKLGEGGIGIVYKARHALLRRPTAVKLLLPGRASEADVKRFEREVQITASLAHPNTIVIFDYGRTADRTFYYAMELLEGINLEQLVTRDGPVHPGRVVSILVQACGALSEAHAAGLIHRDIKPANLMLCQRGGVPDVVKVLDFGMVKERGVVSDVSQTGISYGTPLYLAPEAISDPQTIDGRADLYALGLVAYYMLCGARAVVGVTLAEVLHQHLSVIPESPSHQLGKTLPRGLEAAVLRCLAKDPDDRPANAEALRQLLLSLDDVPAWTDGQARAWWAGRVISDEHARARPPSAADMPVEFRDR